MKTFIQRLAENRRGSALTEFALISPILLLFAVGGVDYGLIVNEKTVLENAARAGAQYALSGTVNETQIQAAVAKAGQFNADGYTVSVSYDCKCPDGTAIACTGQVCTAANADEYGDMDRRRYVTINVGETYTPLFSYPWLPSPYVLQGSADVRLY